MKRMCALLAATLLVAGCFKMPQIVANNQAAPASNGATSLGGLLKNGQQAAAAPAGEWFVGRWSSRGDCASGADVEFTAAGALVYQGSPGNWRRDGSDYLLTNRDGREQRFQIRRGPDDTMVIEGNGGSASHVRCTGGSQAAQGSPAPGAPGSGLRDITWLLGTWGEDGACGTTVTLRGDNTWTISAGGRSATGRYTLGEENGQLVIELLGAPEATRAVVERTPGGFRTTEGNGERTDFARC